MTRQHSAKIDGESAGSDGDKVLKVNGPRQLARFTSHHVLELQLVIHSTETTQVVKEHHRTADRSRLREGSVSAELVEDITRNQ